MHVAVIGAGIGGLTAAAALASAGIDCRVFERGRPDLDAAAGLQLSPNAVGPALRLGLGPALREHAVAIEGIEVRSWQGRPIAWTPLGARCEAAFGAPYYTIHRTDLHDALAARVDPATVETGRAVAAVAQDDDHADIRFTDGSRHRADAVVGADGLHSAVRTCLVDDAVVPSGLVALRGIVDVSELPRGAGAPVARVWMGPGAHIVCYPVSGGRALSFTAVLPERSHPEPAASFDGWHASVRLLAGAARQVHLRALHDREPLARWTDRRATVLGDAAHPMLPFLAQGANQAIEDAVVLATQLSGATVAGVADALDRYAAQRSGRTADLVRAARAHARVIHLPDGPRQRRRDDTLGRSSGLADRAWLFAPEPPTFITEEQRRTA